ncbi:MAG: helix-turn-helix domain-containing protein, partial [Mesorhizobium sp.]
IRAASRRRRSTALAGVAPVSAAKTRAKFLGLMAARMAVESSNAALDRIAEQSGFGDAGRMRRAFMRSFGQPPQAIRRAAVRSRRMRR